ncbi:NT5D3-like protein [Mya arenaria]|uniref:NT5D3-like protein n=1 Tax=Mya arenaria TaxID=6604 RepID=A0ABY7G090_MYAAR|nr:NT5D3-like protein [Mya arenaria]
MASALIFVCRKTRHFCKKHRCWLKSIGYRGISSNSDESFPDWRRIYQERKKQIQDIPSHESEKYNKSGVFVNNEICLADIRVYGFDYDYTIAQYTDELHYVLYDLGKESLITNNKGPMHQLVDMFAPPEMNLITNITDYFIENNIPYDPEYVFYDVRGNFNDFRHMTGWHGSKDPSLKHSWRTGAIIPELEDEIEKMLSEEYKVSVRWLIILQRLLEEIQASRNGSQQETGSHEMIGELLEERDEIRSQLKELCNPRFGSMFRTHHNPSYFSRRMARFADIYTSKLTNLLQFSENYTFYPRRSFLPHERYPFYDPSNSPIDLS